MPETARYFKLNDTVGLNPVDGTLDPIASFTTTYGVLTQVGDDIIPVAQTVALAPSDKRVDPGRILPGSRVLEITDPTVANAMGGHPDYHEVDKPSKSDLTAHVNTVGKAKENAAELQATAAEQEQAISEEQS